MDSTDIECQSDLAETETISRSVSNESFETCSTIVSMRGNKESPFCRICYQSESTSDGNENPGLISPCNCMGTMANVHQHCLQRWASIASTSSCDICGFNYRSRETYPTFFRWIREVIASKEFTVDLLITSLMLISTPLIITATILSSLVRLSSNDSLKPLIYSLWSITLFSWILYITMLFFTIRFLHKSFKTWREKNINVELVWDQNTGQQICIENYI